MPRLPHCYNATLVTLPHCYNATLAALPHCCNATLATLLQCHACRTATLPLSQLLGRCVCNAEWDGAVCHKKRQVAVCTADGDPHWNTFDGKAFDFYEAGEFLQLSAAAGRVAVLRR
jgi:hypothetical protein